MNNNIKKIRTNKEITQQELADFLGVSQKTVSRIEAGEVTLTDEQCKQIATCLKCKVSDIVVKDRMYFINNARECGNKTKKTIDKNDLLFLRKSLIYNIEHQDRDGVIDTILQFSSRVQFEYEFIYKILESYESNKDFAYAFAIALVGEEDV